MPFLKKSEPACMPVTFSIHLQTTTVYVTTQNKFILLEKGAVVLALCISMERVAILAGLE